MDSLFKGGIKGVTKILFSKLYDVPVFGLSREHHQIVHVDLTPPMLMTCAPKVQKQNSNGMTVNRFFEHYH